MKDNKTIELTDYLSITDAVKLTGIRDSKIKYLIYRGKLKAVKIGWQWFVRKSDLEEFLKNFENDR